MEHFIQALTPLAIVITAITPIVMTLIKETARNSRKRMELGSVSDKRSKDTSPMAQTQEIDVISTKRRVESLIGLVALFMALAQLSMLQLGPRQAFPLTSGDAAALAQSLVLVAMGLWLMAKR